MVNILCLLFLPLSPFVYGLELEGIPKNYNEILKSLKHKEKLVFDISNFLAEQDQPPKSGFDFDFEGWNNGHKTGVNLTQTLYFNWEGIFPSNENLTVGDDLETLQNHIANITQSFHSLYGSSTGFTGFVHGIPLQHSQSMSPDSMRTYIGKYNISAFTVIFQVHPSSFRLTNETQNMFADFISDHRSNSGNIRIGIQFTDHYDYRDLQNENYPWPAISQLDVIIVDVDISPNNFILSYTLFKEHLRRSLDRNTKHITSNAKHCTIYARLNFPMKPKTHQNNFHLTNNLYHRYYFYLLQFSVIWANQEKEPLILMPFSIHRSFEHGLGGVESRKLLIISTNLGIESLNDQACEMRELMEHASSNFDSIKLFRRSDRKQIEKPSKSTTNILANGAGSESSVCHRPNFNFTIPNIHIHHYEYPRTTDFTDEVNDIKGALNGLSWQLLEIGRETRNFPSNLQMGLAKLPPNVSYACGIHLNLDVYQTREVLRVEHIFKKCAPIWNEANVIVLKFQLPCENEIGEFEIQNRLLGVELLRQHFMDEFPDKELVWRIELILRPQFSFSGLPKPITNNISLELENTFEYTEDGDIGNGGWKTLKNVDELNMTRIRFPVYVGRNLPDTFLLGEIKTDPCVNWSKQVPNDGVPINSKYSGTTLYMGGLTNHSLSLEELTTLLIFSFHKFSLIEIIPHSFADLNLVISALSQKDIVQSSSRDRNHATLKVYLRIDVQFFEKVDRELDDFLVELTKNSEILVTPKGIHFANWYGSFIFHDSTLKRLKSRGILIGMSLEDCVEDANNHFQSVKGHPQFSQLDYLLCNIKPPMETSNEDEERMAKHLDTTLYIEKYFRRLFINEGNHDLLFRLNTIPPVTNNTILSNYRLNQAGQLEENFKFLTFFSDVSQYAALNKLKLFMFPAFDDMTKRPLGWWRILNHQTLVNFSNFIEREAEYLGNNTWRPPQHMVVAQDWKGPIIILLCMFIVVLSITVISIAFWHHRKFAMLTKNEVNSFRYGQSGDDGSGTEKEYDYREFPVEFELDRRRFVLENIIGQGNFGLVYNATLTDENGEGMSSGAIKIPLPGVSRQSFRSMLSELKVLCYVGSHPHVLQFVGAYTKEIGRGVIYIATELCEKGALQEHLRKCQSSKLQQTGLDQVGSMSPNSYELYRFAYEIAKGMEYVSSKRVNRKLVKIVHGDLSTRNVLLDSELRCKIADFGLSRKLQEYKEEYVKMSKEPLPWRWMALETLKRMEFTTMSDVWSYGVTLWEICSLGDVPYAGVSWCPVFVEELENGRQLLAPKHCSSEIYQRMLSCCDISPEQRPSFEELGNFFAELMNQEYVHI